MVRAVALLSFLLLQLTVALRSQEVLLPLQSAPAQRPVAKEAVTPVELPFFDDFAAGGGTLSPLLWQPQGGTTAADGAGLLPPTVGVATLDAIDATGNLFFAAPSALFPADTLLSAPVRLEGLTPDDSVVFSFYYLPGGGWGNLWERVGDTPDAGDSLFLDFYRTADSTWVTVWCRDGVSVDTLRAATGRDWQYVAIALRDDAYFDSTFRFRFRNYCSLTESTKPGFVGNSDYWHLDYILLDRGREVKTTPEFRDVGFVTPAPTMLSAYQAMPARQYRTREMEDSLRMTITNLYSSALATQYVYAVVDDQSGDTVYRYDGGFENAPPYLPGGMYQTDRDHARPAVGYAFPEGQGKRSYTVVHMIRESVSGDGHRANDTVRFRQVFDNYYAYDDGTAENGYGLTSTASHLYLAYRFDLNEADSLTAVDLYFNRTASGGNEDVPFYITVWSNRDGKPGDVLYRDQVARIAEFDGLNRYWRYLLDEPVVVDGSVFVGFEQINNHFVNLGFDRSRNTSDRIYYLTGTAWQQSILSGSLMLRPCFGHSATVGIELLPAAVTLHVYPNPASGVVHVEGVPEGSALELLDVTGRKVCSVRGTTMDVGNLPDGFYILRCVASQGEVYNGKLIIRN